MDCLTSEKLLSTTYGLAVVTGSTGEALELGEVKEHLRVEIDDDDGLIGRLITGARNYVQEQTLRPLLPMVFDYRRDRFPRGIRPIELPVYPVLSSPAIVITYIDGAGVTQTLASDQWKASLDREPCRIVPAYGKVWPTARTESDAVTIRFPAGYADPAAVPQDIKHAMLLLLGEFYENREAGVVSERLAKVVGGFLAPYSYDAEFADFGA